MSLKRTLNLPVLAVLLLGAAARFAPIASVPMWWDEVWSMWQTQGSFAQTLALTPYDWPPLYYLLLRTWTYLVGPNDVTGRVLSVLFALAGIAFLYRAGRAIGGAWTGLFAALILAVLPYSVYLSMEARGYALLMLFAPMLAWLHIRWLHKPNMRRTVIYAITMALCLYTSYTGALLIGLTLAHGLVAALTSPPNLLSVYREGESGSKRVALVSRVRGMRAWLAAVISLVLLSLPLAPRLAVLVGIRKGNIEQRLAPPGIDQVLPNFYGWLDGKQPELMVVLIGLALIGLGAWLISRLVRRTVIDVSFVLLWAIAAPLLMYLFRYQLLLVATRYLLYIVPGIALAIGFGFSRFPRAIKPLLILPVLLYIVVPLPVENYRPALSDEKPIRDIVRELGRRYQPGDQVLIDPNCNCGRPVEWSYYEEIYYPGGHIHFVSQDAYGTPQLINLDRRVWYIVDQRGRDSGLLGLLRGYGTETSWFGPYYMFVSLWETNPTYNEPPLKIADRFFFEGYDILSRQPLHAGDNLSVRLWWRNGDRAQSDYSLRIKLIAPDGMVISKMDKSILEKTLGGTWQPFDTIVTNVDFDLPSNVREGNYALQLDIQGLQGTLYLGSVYLFNYYVQ